MEGVSPVVLANDDGTFTQRSFYDGATWMNEPSSLLLEQIDAAGNVVAPPILTSIGSATDERPSDGFFIRRLRAIQWTNDCVSTTDCTGASNFMEEALVEVRNAVDRSNTFRVHPNTAAFRLSWSLKSTSWTIPVTQVATPTYDYGFSIDIDPSPHPAQAESISPAPILRFARRCVTARATVCTRSDRCRRTMKPSLVPTSRVSSITEHSSTRRRRTGAESIASET